MSGFDTQPCISLALLSLALLSLALGPPLSRALPPLGYPHNPTARSAVALIRPRVPQGTKTSYLAFLVGGHLRRRHRHRG